MIIMLMELEVVGAVELDKDKVQLWQPLTEEPILVVVVVEEQIILQHFLEQAVAQE
jgi:hypothetical protein